MKDQDSQTEKILDITGKFFGNRIEEEWLSTIQAAQFLKVSENALRIMVHRGQITAYKLGRRLRFRIQDCRVLLIQKGA